jgi:hypothetical protein
MSKEIVLIPKMGHTEREMEMPLYFSTQDENCYYEVRKITPEGIRVITQTTFGWNFEFIGNRKGEKVAIDESYLNHITDEAEYEEIKTMALESLTNL